MMKPKKKGWRSLISFFLSCFLFSVFPPSSFSAVTIQQEQELGDKVLQEIRKRWSLVQEPSANEYINRIGNRILQNMEAQPFNYQFFILNVPEINAFAVPGGKIFVNSGLVLLAGNEDELAGVVAHEIGHIVARHIVKRSEKGQMISLATIGAILAGIFAGGKAAGAIATTTLAASQTALLKYSRDDEEEADYLGLKFMERAGYDPLNMITMLKKIRRMEGPAAGDPPAYLVKHPAVEERTASLEIQMSRIPKEKELTKTSGNLQRIQTKLIVEEQGTALAVSYFENWLKRKPDDPEAFFGLGLAQKRMGGLDRAIDNFTKAAGFSPQDGEIARELGATYLLKANFPEAQKNLELARTLSPADAMTYFYLGRLYSEQKRADEALAAFRRAKELDPQIPEIQYHLAMAYGAKDMLGPAYLNFGYYYKSINDSKTALIHFNKALAYFSENSVERQAIQKEIQELTPKKK